MVVAVLKASKQERNYEFESLASSVYGELNWTLKPDSYCWNALETTNIQILENLKYICNGVYSSNSWTRVQSWKLTSREDINVACTNNLPIVLKITQTNPPSNHNKLTLFVISCYSNKQTQKTCTSCLNAIIRPRLPLKKEACKNWRNKEDPWFETAYIAYPVRKGP